MRLAKMTTLAIVGFLIVSVPVFASSIPYSFSGNGFSVLSQPIKQYLGTTYLYTPTGPDYSITDWVGPLWFSTGLTVLSVPTSWPTWNCPPRTESYTPRVLATPGDSLDINIEYGYPDAKIFGFELQPTSQGTDEVLADFFSGSTLVGTVDQLVSGNGGAVLFAAVRTSYFWVNGQRYGGFPFTDVQITDLAGHNFAIANLRAAPEPSALLILGSGVLALVASMRRKRVA